MQYQKFRTSIKWSNFNIPQVRLLRDMLLILEKQDPEKFINVEVATVDGFQGREKEVPTKLTYGHSNVCFLRCRRVYSSQLRKVNTESIFRGHVLSHFSACLIFCKTVICFESVNLAGDRVQHSPL